MVKVSNPGEKMNLFLCLMLDKYMKSVVSNSQVLVKEGTACREAWLLAPGVLSCQNRAFFLVSQAHSCVIELMISLTITNTMPAARMWNGLNTGIPVSPDSFGTALFVQWGREAYGNHKDRFDQIWSDLSHSHAKNSFSLTDTFWIIYVPHASQRR